MFEWLSDTFNAVVDFVTGGGDDAGPPDPCDVGTCLAERAALRAARRDVANSCNWVRLVLAPLRLAVALVSLPILTYVIILVIAAALAGVAGIVAAVAAYLLTLGFIRVWAPVVASAGQALAEAFQREIRAIARVRAQCPSECQGDLTASQCDVGDGNVLPTAPAGRLGGLVNRLMGVPPGR